jgi:transposase
LVAAFNRGEDYQFLAKQLEISRSAARGIIYRYKRYGEVQFGKHGGHKKPLITEDMGHKILDFVERNPTSHLHEIRQHFVENSQFICSTKTLSRYLEGKLISIKKARGTAEVSNTDRIKEDRFQYAFRYISQGWRKGKCVYIDEMGFNLWTRRQYGRSKIGCPVNITVPTNRGSNISLILAIRKTGPIYFELHDGAINRSIYQQFLNNLTTKLSDSSFFFIHDNASIHRNTTSTNPIFFLPPYSPFLNPIEAFFSKLKRDIRSMNSSRISLLSMTNAERTTALKSCLQTTVQADEYKDLDSYYRHCKSFLAQCFSRSDIYGD